MERARGARATPTATRTPTGTRPSENDPERPPGGVVARCAVARGKEAASSESGPRGAIGGDVRSARPGLRLLIDRPRIRGRRAVVRVVALVGWVGCEVRLCDPCARVVPPPPASFYRIFTGIPSLPPVSFYRSRVCPGSPRCLFTGTGTRRSRCGGISATWPCRQIQRRSRVR